MRVFGFQSAATPNDSAAKRSGTKVRPPTARAGTSSTRCWPFTVATVEPKVNCTRVPALVAVMSCVLASNST